MAKAVKVAVVGVTGLVGREMVRILAERGFPAGELVPLASERSIGETVVFGGEEHAVGVASAATLAGAQIVLMAAGRRAGAELAPLAAEAGAVVVDSSSQWRLHDDVPLVVPEVNAAEIARYAKQRIIASPSCSTIQMVVALKPLHDMAGLRRVVVATYQAVSGQGKAAMDELGEQVAALFNQRQIEPRVFPKRIAFNCIPQVDALMGDGFTREELKIRDETRKVLGLPALGVCATCVRVPVFNGHGQAVVAEFDRTISAAEAREALRRAPGVMLMDDPAGAAVPTPADSEGSDATFVGRIREDPSSPTTLAFWCVADNLRKGAATNAVQIAELLARDYL